MSHQLVFAAGAAFGIVLAGCGGISLSAPDSSGATGQLVMASQEGIEKPTPERSFQLTLASTLAVSLSRGEVTGRVLQPNAPACETLASNPPSGVSVTLYRMPTVTTTSKTFSAAIVGKHYDPLVPVAETGGQVCPADAFVLADIAVGTSVAPGNYPFTIGDLPVTLHVWNLTIPAQPAMPVYIQLESFALLAAHGLPSGSSVNVEAALAQKYVNLMRAHRVEPIEQRIVDPSPSGSSMNLDQYSAQGASFREVVMTGALGPVDVLTPTPISSSWDTAAQLQAWEASWQIEPGLAGAWTYITDEPTDLTGTATRAQLVRTNAPDLKTMVTHEPTAGLVGLIDHFTVIFEYFKTAGHWSDYTQAPGYWIYGSCTSHGSCVNGSPGTLTGTPDLMLDENDVFGRAFPLVAYALGASAELYYDAVYSISTAWTNQYFFGGNGDGNLLYPGVAGAMGFTDNEPVGSLRMNAIRQGQFDIEYLKLAAAASLSTSFSSLVPDQFHWSQHNSDYEAMRMAIGNALGGVGDRAWFHFSL